MAGARSCGSRGLTFSSIQAKSSRGRGLKRPDGATSTATSKASGPRCCSAAYLRWHQPADRAIILLAAFRSSVEVLFITGSELKACQVRAHCRELGCHSCSLVKANWFFQGEADRNTHSTAI